MNFQPDPKPWNLWELDFSKIISDARHLKGLYVNI